MSQIHGTSHCYRQLPDARKLNADATAQIREIRLLEHAAKKAVVQFEKCSKLQVGNAYYNLLMSCNVKPGCVLCNGQRECQGDRSLRTVYHATVSCVGFVQFCGA